MIIYTDSSFNEKSKVAGIGWNTKNGLADLLSKEGVIKFLESQGTKQKPKPPCIFVLPDQNQR